ncbi:hypothetical protein [Micrococcus luteus]|uniref:hypothetical protein n=1 Tax=Micrococcus luteus TaxID=1270 RepID=UPI001CDAEA29|nr:hypothetical protein [Micrococcus luteus]
MNHIGIKAIFKVTDGVTRQLLDLQSDLIADALINMEASAHEIGLKDSAVSVDFATNEVTIEVTMDHYGVPEGRAFGESCINRAIQIAHKETQVSEVMTHQSADLVCA